MYFFQYIFEVVCILYSFQRIHFVIFNFIFFFNIALFRYRFKRFKFYFYNDLITIHFITFIDDKLNTSIFLCQKFMFKKL